MVCKIMMLSDPIFDPENPTADYWLDIMRAHRNRLLAESDWTQTSDAPVDRQAWATYRQQLRDFPATWTPSDTANFPDPPT
jgi:hypothetical protein